MKYRHLGQSGLVVSEIGLGCNNLGAPNRATSDFAAANDVVRAALDAGITFFDNADVYGSPRGNSEEFLGRSLRGIRDDIVVATKFGKDMRGVNGPDYDARGGRWYIVRAVEKSLRRLGMDHIDLYQMHAPDPAVPLEETLGALDDLVRSGKVRYIGCSNFAGWQLVDAHWVAQTSGLSPFISAQNEYSLLNRGVETDLLPAAARFGAGFIPFFPLADGLLTGKYRRDNIPADSRIATLKPQRIESIPWLLLEELEDFCVKRDITMLQVAFGWLLAQPTVASVIAGATRPEQVVANAATSGAWTPSSDDLTELDRITAAAAAN